MLERNITQIPAFLSINQEFTVCLLVFKAMMLVPVTYKIIWLNSIIEDVVLAFSTCVYSEVSWYSWALRDRNIKCNKEKHFFFQVVEMRVVYFETSYVNVTGGGKVSQRFQPIHACTRTSLLAGAFPFGAVSIFISKNDSLQWKQ